MFSPDSRRFTASPAPAGSPAQVTPAPAPVAIPVITPTNNPQAFQSLTYTRPQTQGPRPQGAELMTRIEMSLKCGIETERVWALRALLGISLRSAQVLQFKNLPDVVSALLDEVYASPAFDEELSQEPKKAAVSLAMTDRENTIAQRALEALLVLRNASLDPENGQFLAHDPRIQTLLVRALHLPNIHAELRAYCVEITEAIAFHLTPDTADDPLLAAVLFVLRNVPSDRGLAVPALRALARLLVRDDHNVLRNVPSAFLSQVTNYLLVDDEELISASLDFLYQFTSSGKNVARLLETATTEALISTHLIRLLTFRIEEPKMDVIRLPRRTKLPAPKEPPKMPDDVMSELLEFPEPHRATHWIRSAYEFDSEAEVTQISLWKAYEAQFEEHARLGKRLLPAVDFIKNVTNAFKDAAAMVVNLPDGQRRFIIKGLRPREYAVAPSVLNGTSGSQDKQNQKREPSGFGVTAALVLQNIAQSEEGKALLLPEADKLAQAAILNPNIPAYVYQLLESIAS
uniref:ARAD1D15752p n=1 Tax=Blastobotrys adeninivorans TaxID=409370 RepID=A0A060TEK3_BLAAD